MTPQARSARIDVIQTRVFDRFAALIQTAVSRGPNGKAFALVAGAVVLWASWPALATIAHPAPAFLVLGLSALIGCAVSFLDAARRSRTSAFLSVRPATLVFVAFGLMGNNAFYLAAISR
ncbi:MAG: hypothetical protein AAF360_18120, partial [Pseudomonadota bacterium]